MAAIVQIVESNGAGGATTVCTNMNMGSGDYANITNPATLPITAGNNGYEKWVRIYCQNISTSQYIGTFKVWITSVVPLGSDIMYCFATESSYASKWPYAQPVATDSTYATYDMGTFWDSEPSGANLGYNNSLTGTMTTGLYTDYFISQVHVDSGSTAGTTATFNFKYTEVA